VSQVSKKRILNIESKLEDRLNPDNNRIHIVIFDFLDEKSVFIIDGKVLDDIDNFIERFKKLKGQQMVVLNLIPIEWVGDLSKDLSESLQELIECNANI